MDAMFSRGSGRRRLQWVFVSLLSFVFLTGTPFGHREVSCHFKTPQHCQACSPDHVGSRPYTPPMPGAWALDDAGAAMADLTSAKAESAVVATAGRSPPFAI
jgi:hypothetical protein